MPSMLFLPKVTTPLARSMTEYFEQRFEAGFPASG